MTISDPVRRITVAPERLERWLAGFSERHGASTYALERDVVRVRGADEAAAGIMVPFPPLLAQTLPAGLLDHVARERTVGALLVRKGGTAVGVFRGRRLLTSKVETHYVQSRTKAGGWSQQRYARRRDNQAREVVLAAAALVLKIILPVGDDLDALSAGGDSALVTAVFADSRLARLVPLLQPRIHPVPDPRLAVLQAFPEQFLAVEISLNALA